MRIRPAIWPAAATLFDRYRNDSDSIKWPFKQCEWGDAFLWRWNMVHSLYFIEFGDVNFGRASGRNRSSVTLSMRPVLRRVEFDFWSSIWCEASNNRDAWKVDSLNYRLCATNTITSIEINLSLFSRFISVFFFLFIFTVIFFSLLLTFRHWNWWFIPGHRIYLFLLFFYVCVLFVDFCIEWKENTLRHNRLYLSFHLINKMFEPNACAICACALWPRPR